ncbi:putative mediator of RNA polymerase II transcription, partial [Trifolium medium]|nr:putative mediator of RNA polymerase II transcription [Trifolium medium]
IPDFAYSPNPHNGSSGSDRNNSEVEPKPKPKPVPRKDPPPKLRPSPPVTAPTNATQNVMDIHELPKSKAKNGYFPKNRGGGSSQGRQHW